MAVGPDPGRKGRLGCGPFCTRGSGSGQASTGLKHREYPRVVKPEGTPEELCRRKGGCDEGCEE